MHKYWRHLGDYAKATAHLTMLEHGAYTVLLDLAYAKERPLPLSENELFRVTRARSAAEKRAVRSVRDEFFESREDGWVQARVLSEIAEYQTKSEKNRDSATKRWQSERDANALPADSERNASRARSDNQQPATGNQSSAAAAHPGELPLAESSIVGPPAVGTGPSGRTMEHPAPVPVARKKERGAGAGADGQTASLRPRDLCYEFLVNMTGASLATVTKGMRGEINAALRDIRTVSPDLTPKDLAGRASAYRAKFRDAHLSPSALAKHWGSLKPAEKKERGGEPVWQWREFALVHLGIGVDLAWKDLLERMRDEITAAYAALPAQAKEEWS